MLLSEGGLLAREARHRVANDLAAAMGALRLAATGGIADARLTSAIERLEAAAEINQILCREPTDAVVELAQTLERLRRPLARTAAAAGWNLHFDVPAMGVDDADAMRVALIVGELVSNALRHASGAGERIVSVRVVESDNFTRVVVADGGAPRAWSRAGGQGGQIVDALAWLMLGSVRRGIDGRGVVEVVMPSIARSPAKRIADAGDPGELVLARNAQSVRARARDLRSEPVR